MKAVAAVIGTRAQLVKMAPLIRAFERRGVRVFVASSGQHAKSMAELASDLGVASHFPDVDAAVERNSPIKLLLWILPAFARLVGELRRMRRSGASICLVHGDTLSTLLGAIASKLAGLSVGHVESGLTSGRMLAPFPEELTRRLVFRCADWAFCPTEENVALMRRISAARIVNTNGNTIEDALAAVELSGIVRHGKVVVSLHRYENIFDAPRLSSIVAGLMDIARTRSILFVLHPPTEAQLKKHGLLDALASSPGIELHQRMPYTAFIAQLAASSLVITDGGSNQEELALLGVPTLILRRETERRDGLGRNAVLESDVSDWVDFVASGSYEQLRTSGAREYGGVSDRIVDALVSDRA